MIKNGKYYQSIPDSLYIVIFLKINMINLRPIFQKVLTWIISLKDNFDFLFVFFFILMFTTRLRVQNQKSQINLKNSKHLKLLPV